MNKKLAAIVLSAALTLALAPVAAAATVTESLTVNGAVSMTGVPASITYGTLDPGTTGTAPVFSIVVTANTPWQIDINGTDFARTGGGGTIDRNNRQIDGAFGGTAFASKSTDIGSGWSPFAGTLTDATWDLRDSSSSLSFPVALRVLVPAGQKAGAYTGSVSFLIAAQP